MIFLFRTTSQRSPLITFGDFAALRENLTAHKVIKSENQAFNRNRQPVSMAKSSPGFRVSFSI